MKGMGKLASVTVILCLPLAVGFLSAKACAQDIVVTQSGQISTGFAGNDARVCMAGEYSNITGGDLIASRRARRDDGESSYQAAGPKRKKPVVAWLMSFLVPGLGQYYNGGSENITKGVIQEVLYLGGVIVAYTVGITTTTHTYGYYSYTTTEVNAAYGGGMLVAGISYVWSMIDAPLSAKAINREIDGGQSGSRDYQKGVVVTLGPVGDSMGGMATLYF